MPPDEPAASQTVSAEVPDYTREIPRRGWDPPRRLIRSIRSYQKWDERRGLMAWLLRKVAILRHRFWSVVTASDIPVSTKIDGGLLLIHPVGIVIHPAVTIGPNCLILQNVTLVGGVKVLGHVDIGAGAVIVRPVTIGKHAKIGANAVVTTDVPDYATAVGVPARIISRRSDHYGVGEDARYSA
jgi:serine O-acetyltransferase